MSAQTLSVTIADVMTPEEMPNGLTSWAEFAGGVVTLADRRDAVAELTPAQARYLAACLISCADYAEGVER